jgi:hypothetical protein
VSSTCSATFSRVSRTAARAMGLVTLMSATAAASACLATSPVLTGLIEARRLAAELHVAFTKASEASSRAVMASSDDASAAAAADARTARQES